MDSQENDVVNGNMEPPQYYCPDPENSYAHAVYVNGSQSSLGLCGPDEPTFTNLQSYHESALSLSNAPPWASSIAGSTGAVSYPQKIDQFQVAQRSVTEIASASIPDLISDGTASAPLHTQIQSNAEVLAGNQQIENSAQSGNPEHESQLQSECALHIPPPCAPGHKLANLLANDIEGRIIFRSYAHHNTFLSATARKYLVHFIINVELRKALMTLSPFGSEKLEKFSITTDQLTAWSLEIAGLFASESSHGYYSPFRVVNGVRKDTTGKLWEHYNYIKGVLKDEGILNRNSKEKTKDSEQSTVTLTDSDAVNLKWLETKCTPLDELLDKWKNTFSARRDILMKQNKTVLEYYANFLGLRVQEGIHLIQADFNRLYPNECEAFDTKWDLIKDHLISKLRNSKAVKDVNDKALLLSVPALTRDQQASAIFHLLPLIAGTDRTCKKRKISCNDNSGQAVRRASMQEIRESFTLRVPIAADVEPELAKVRTNLQKNGLSCQPMPIVVGTITQIQACYVLVDDTVYRVKNYIDALDLTFKIFYVTNSKYPERSKSLWQLVQKGIFGIGDDYEKCSTWVKFLAAELRTIIVRQTGKA